jgi:spermidine synthase
MNPRGGGPRPHFARILLLLAFFLSGYAALSYETAWVRQLVSLFGVTHHAITTILTVFMLGLAAGAWIAGNLVDRRGLSPLPTFALLELGLGLYAQVFPWLQALAQQLYVSAGAGAELSSSYRTALRFLLGAALLLPPALASGATLPVACKAFVGQGRRLGRALSGLYAANVLGAVLGAGGTTFLGIGLLGFPGTAWLASFTSVAAAGLALFAWRLTALSAAAPTSPQVSAASSLRHPAALAYLVAGFAGLGGEVLWTRVFSQQGPNSATGVFGLVLVAYLLGHATGAGPLFRVLRRRWEPASLVAPLLAGMALCFGIAVALMAWAPPLGGGLSLVRGLGLQLLPGWEPVLVLGVVAPAAASGALFPLAASLTISGPAGVGRGAGGLSALATIGGIGGSLVAGFWVLPQLGAVRGVGALALLCGLSAVALALRQSGGGVSRLAWAGGGALGAGGLAVLVALAPPWAHLPLFPASRVVAFSEGRNTSAAVVEPPRGERYLYVHGEIVTGGGTDVSLAWALAPYARSCTVIGLGAGMVVEQALEQPSFETVRAVDFASELLGLMPSLDPERDEALKDPRFAFVDDDGRHALLTSPLQHDIIVNDAAIYAWYLELSTLEFNRLVRSRLAPEGLYVGRLHAELITDEAWRRQIATFLAVFPNAALWSTRGGEFGMLVGRNGERPVDRLAAELPAALYHEPRELWMDAAQLRAWVGDAAPLTDARPMHIPATFAYLRPGAVHGLRTGPPHPSSTSGQRPGAPIP